MSLSLVISLGIARNGNGLCLLQNTYRIREVQKKAVHRSNSNILYANNTRLSSKNKIWDKDFTTIVKNATHSEFKETITASKLSRPKVQQAMTVHKTSVDV